MQHEDTMLSTLYVSFSICTHYKANSLESNKAFHSSCAFISLQIHVEYRTSISPSAANKTPQSSTCGSIEKVSKAQQ